MTLKTDETFRADENWEYIEGFSSKLQAPAGVPMGGIGAGKIEINKNGKMVNLTIANNWGRPISWMPGFHVLIRPDHGKPFFIENDVFIKGFSRFEPDAMSYVGKYPFATLKAKKGGVVATLEAFSPIIPGNLSDSTLPAIGIAIKVEGSESGSVTVSATNYSGSHLVGRMNMGIKGGVSFVNPKTNDYDVAKGDLSLIGSNPSNICVQFNARIRSGIRLQEYRGPGRRPYESEEPWTSIIEGRKFPEDVHELEGMSDLASAFITSRYDRWTEMKHVYSWYYTGKNARYPYGHFYHNRFRCSEDVAGYFLSNFDRMRQQTRAWHETLIPSDLPEWLRDAIVNSAYILSSSTWLDEKGRFAIFEGSQVCTLLGTIAGFTHEVGSLPVMKMFPELEKSFLRMLAASARKDGYIPHDLGDNSMDHPSDGTTAPPKWKDLCPNFVMLAYRYAKWIKDPQFLTEMYPTMRRAMEWNVNQDLDGDGLPELQGDGESSFDATAIRGIDAYTSSVHIAGLIAMREASKALGKDEDAERFSALAVKAKKSFAETFYNGKYFEAWKGDPSCAGYRFLAQIAGDWWTNILEVEPVADREKIESAYSELYRLNAQASRFCTPNAVNEMGIIWSLGVQTYSSQPRMVFSIAGARYRDGDKRWIEVAKKEWDNLVAHGLAWDHPSRMDARTGMPDPEVDYLDHYIGSPGLWTFIV